MFKVNAVFTGGKNYQAAISPHILANIAKYKLDKYGSTCPTAQRKFNAKHCKFIAVGNAESFQNGVHLPHLVMISINSTKLLKNSKSGKVTLMLPETDDEIMRYADMIEIIDGQHRTMSFHPEFAECITPDDYKLGVTILECPTEKEKIYYFKVLNTGAKIPDKDLICQHNRVLSDDKAEQEFQHIYDLLLQLNTTQGGLYGSIRTGNCEGGGKLISIASLCNSHLTKKKGVNLDDALIGMNCKTTDKKVEMMRKYMFAWNNYFANGANRFDAHNKKTRYNSKNYSIFALQFAAPIFEALAQYNNKRWNEAKVKELFGILKSVLNITADISEIKMDSGAADRNRFAHKTIAEFKKLATTHFANKAIVATNTAAVGVVVVNHPANVDNKFVKKVAKNTLKAKV